MGGGSGGRGSGDADPILLGLDLVEETFPLGLAPVRTRSAQPGESPVGGRPVLLGRRCGLERMLGEADYGSVSDEVYLPKDFLWCASST